jgi:hypothetical protein
MKHSLAENMRRFHTKNLKEDAYTESQAETRLKQLIDRVFQNVSNSQTVKENGTAKLQSPEPGFYTIMLNKPGKFLKRARTGQLNVYLDQDPKHLVITVKINGEPESEENFDWGDGLFADDDAAYEKVADVATTMANFVMSSKN